VSRTTIANTLAEIVALFGAADGTPVAALTAAGVTHVYGFEPGAGGVKKPCSVTVAFSGLDPTDTLFTVRVYVSGDTPPTTAQDLLIASVDACDDALLGGVGFGPSAWDVGWVAELGAWIAVSQVRAGREDF